MQEPNNETSSLIFYLQEIGVLVVLLICIVARIVGYAQENCSWIWLVNYIGMAIAFFNIFLAKIIEFYENNDEDYKPLFGLTIFVLIILIIIGVFVGFLQTSEIALTLNDVITLFSLFWSLGGRIWDVVIEKIARRIK